MALPIGLQAGLKAKTVVTFRNEAGQEVSDEYAATCLSNAIVYKKNGKSIKTDEVPEAVKGQLVATMLVGAKAPEVTPPAIDKASTPVSENNFPAIENEAEIAATAALLDTPAPADDLGFDNVQAPEIDLAAELAEAEARSVDNVNLRDLVTALYNRFGIYTVYMNRPPAREDVNPLTGQVMNMLTLGQANQGFKQAQRTGASWNPKVIQSEISTSRAMRGHKSVLPQTTLQQNQVVGDDYGTERHMPSLHGEPARRVNRRYESPHQSVINSVRGKEGDGTDPDEIYAEPPINAKNSIVRPFFVNEQSQEQLERISRTRRPRSAGGVTSFDQIV